jgi:hypothetical protein
MARAAGISAYTVRDRCMVGGVKKRRWTGEQLTIHNYRGESGGARDWGGSKWARLQRLAHTVVGNLGALAQEIHSSGYGNLWVQHTR